MSAKQFLKATQPYIYTTEAAKLLDISAPISSEFIKELESDINLGTNSDVDVLRYDTEGANSICTFSSASDSTFGDPSPSYISSTANATKPTNIHTILPSSSTETFTIGPLVIRVLEDGTRTSNRLSAVMITLPPKSTGTPMRWNEEHGEGFLVTRGRVRFSTRQHLNLNVSDAVSHALNGEEGIGVVPGVAPETKANLRMAEELLHLGATPISQDHELRKRRKDQEIVDGGDYEGIPDDIDIGLGGWVTVPQGARHTFSNPFEEEAEMVNTSSPGQYISYLRQMSKECADSVVRKESSAEVMGDIGTKSL